MKMLLLLLLLLPVCASCSDKEPCSVQVDEAHVIQGVCSLKTDRFGNNLVGLYQNDTLVAVFLVENGKLRPLYVSETIVLSAPPMEV